MTRLVVGMAAIGMLITLMFSFSASADTLGVDNHAKNAAGGLPTNLDAQGIIGNVIDFLLGLVGLLSLLALIWGGVLMITGFGNEKRVETAKHVIFWAIVGLIVVLLAWAIINIVIQITNKK